MKASEARELANGFDKNKSVTMDNLYTRLHWFAQRGHYSMVLNTHPYIDPVFVHDTYNIIEDEDFFQDIREILEGDGFDVEMVTSGLGTSMVIRWCEK